MAQLNLRNTCWILPHHHQTSYCASKRVREQFGHYLTMYMYRYTYMYIIVVAGLWRLVIEPLICKQILYSCLFLRLTITAHGIVQFLKHTFQLMWLKCSLPRLKHKLYFSVQGRLKLENTKIHQNPFGAKPFCSLGLLLAATTCSVCCGVFSYLCLVVFSFRSTGHAPPCQHKAEQQISACQGIIVTEHFKTNNSYATKTSNSHNPTALSYALVSATLQRDQPKLTPTFGPSHTERLRLAWELKPGLLAPRAALYHPEDTPDTYP